jgi:glyoxylase-like metal-dependent hydrolase (beta-lactamase superfamily II)
MRDGRLSEAAEEREPLLGRPDLAYPCGEAPAPGEAREIAPGVHWLRMPMGGSLDHINVWALEDGDGWTVVDSGLQTRETAGHWRTALAGPLGGRPVTRVMATHMHPDHIGLAGWLARKHQVRLWMTRLEYISCRMLVADTGREAPEDGVRFYQACGWDEEAIERYRIRFGGFGKMIHALPDSYRRLEDGERIDIGGRPWRVVVGNGHSPEHACLWREDDGVLISGDQVLPRISSNVSVHPTEPDADPLTDWLTSLARLKATVPDSVLVLPSHGEPFRGLHARLDHLIAGHERSLRRLQKRLAEPKRAIDVFGALFGRAIGPDLLGMATGESLAHLNCLRARGIAACAPDSEGVLWWRALAAAPSGDEAGPPAGGPDLRPTDAAPC